MIDPGVARAVQMVMGQPIVAARPLGGGSIARAFAVDLADGRALFLKTHPSLPPRAFQCEATGLRWLGETRTVRVPEVVAVGTEEPFLLLARVEIGQPSRQGDEELGRALAALHCQHSEVFGAVDDNFLATLPQTNESSLDWPKFYRERRLLPLLRAAELRGLVPAALSRSFDRLWSVLAERAGPAEPPSRLHGDLWGGNRIADGEGRSWLIDPAVYAGHREIDLAMMQLFGGFSARVFASYDEAFPRAAEHSERVPLYQLYPLLAHLVMFGRSYLSEVESAIDAVL